MAKIFSKVAVPFYTPTSRLWEFQFLRRLINNRLSIFDCSRSCRYLTAAHVVLILISPVTKRSETFPMFYLCIFSASAELLPIFCTAIFLQGVLSSWQILDLFSDQNGLLCYLLHLIGFSSCILCIVFERQNFKKVLKLSEFSFFLWSCIQEIFA